MEGGGDKAEGKAALRIGMGEFLNPLRDLARKHGMRWRVVACGGRDSAYKAFRHAIDSDPESLCILLVDAESEIELNAAEHLRHRDRWDIPEALAGCVHLMAQVMETWLVADPAALQRFYGQGFAERALPRGNDLEKIDKTIIIRSLEAASIRTTKGLYHKVRHASKLLESLDAGIVRRRCPCCDAFFQRIERAF